MLIYVKVLKSPVHVLSLCSSNVGILKWFIKLLKCLKLVLFVIYIISNTLRNISISVHYTLSVRQFWKGFEVLLLIINTVRGIVGENILGKNNKKHTFMIYVPFCFCIGIYQNRRGEWLCYKYLVFHEQSNALIEDWKLFIFTHNYVLQM